MEIVQEGSTFGSVLDLQVLGFELPDDALIPGVAVATSRAIALAAFTNSLEIASIDVDRQRACLVLSAGVSKRWLYAYYKKNKQTDQEAEAWEAAKKACGGLHFLAIQDSLDSDSCTGFWLILDMPSPPV
ncbi:protein TAB2 homolog, chloroplastic-like [Cryptomeria japonica]|uniref:protein TAB2 homolog, chloroplastic-like n=1 Tax=Cryptomeria japonica TaxID=3369 RepID=UPI0027DA62BF|nr:protein TAB2 homolog, chloroplastic-like [Cryptomeria japonica]